MCKFEVATPIDFDEMTAGNDFLSTNNKFL